MFRAIFVSASTTMHGTIGYTRMIGNRVHDITGTGCASGGADIFDDYYSGSKYRDAIGNHVYNVGPAVRELLFKWHDYRLRASSPAINRGTSNLAPAQDFDGKSRPLGGANDIGAFESY